MTTPDGVYSPDQYRHIATKLEVDDLVVLYGNGFAEAAFPDGDVVGHQHLVEALRDAPNSHPKARLAHLVRLVLDNNEPKEDSTIIVCQVTTAGVRMRDNLLAPLRFFMRPRDATKLM
jgi:hypothetical protein